MIEDLQDEMQQEEPTKKEKPHRRGHFLFLAFIVWVIYATILIMVSLPKMVVAIREANLKETISSFLSATGSLSKYRRYGQGRKKILMPNFR